MCWRMCVCALDVCVPIHVREGVCECVCVRVRVRVRRGCLYQLVCNQCMRKTELDHLSIM